MARIRSGPTGQGYSVAPNIADRTVYASDRRKVLLALMVAFAIRAISHFEKGRDNVDPEKALKAIGSTGIPNWLILVAILTIASDFESTSKLAVAFSLLILVAVLMNNGLEAADVLGTWMDKPREKTRRTRRRRRRRSNA